jgi:hypothetical protein
VRLLSLGGSQGVDRLGEGVGGIEELHAHSQGAAMIAGVFLLGGADAVGAAGNGRPVERPYKEKSFVSAVPGSTTCSPTGPSTLVCTFDYEGVLITSHTGRAWDAGTGVTTVDLGGTCTHPTGLVGLPMTQTLAATITAADGSELFYTANATECLTASETRDYESHGTFTGGTGRFVGASGNFVANGDGAEGVLIY